MIGFETEAPATQESPIPGSASAFSISRLAIRRHIGTLIVMVALLVLGGFAALRLPVDLLPSITYPRIGVRLNAPGIAPEVAVETITKPLEEVMATTEGVEQLFSRTREGQVSLDLYFRPGGNLDRALNDATASLNRARGSLPNAVESPRLFKFDPSQLPVYEFALASPSLTGLELRRFADQELARELGRVPGVANVDVSGGVEPEITITLDLVRLQSLGLTLDPVLNALRERNQDISGGRLKGSGREVLTRVVGKFQSVQEIRDLAFLLPGRMDPVYLRDFASVIDGSAPEEVQVRLNGQPAVRLSVQKQPDANSIQVVDGITDRLASLRQSTLLPPDVTLTVTSNEAVFIRNSLNNVLGSGLLGAGLTGLVVFLFLGSWRQTLIIVVAIPLASLAAISLMSLAGLSLNVFTLGGLALGVGIVVDNSIVMLENIGNRIQSLPLPTPATVMAAASLGGQEVESALLASTTTNLVSVVPFLLLGGFFSLLFNELILCVSFAVASSLLVALTLVPMLCSRLFAIPARSGILDFAPMRLFQQGVQRVTLGYGRLLRQVVRGRWVFIPLVVLSLGWSAWSQSQDLTQEVLPRINTGQAILSAQFPPGTPLDRNREVMARVDSLLQNRSETEAVITTSGGSSFGSNITANPSRAGSTITLKPGADVEAFVAQATQDLDQLNLAGIRLRLRPGAVRGLVLSNSPAQGSDIDVILQSQDNPVLTLVGQDVLQALDDQVTLASFRPDVEDSLPEVQLLPNWSRLSRLNLSMPDLGDLVRTALQGSVPTQLQRQDQLVDVRLRVDPTQIQSTAQLEQVPLFVGKGPLGEGQAVRLGEVVTVREGVAPAEIQRINQRGVFLIAGTLAEKAPFSAAYAQVQAALAQVPFPPGVSLLPSSAARNTSELQSSLRVLGALSIFLVFSVMAIQYNSLLDPLIIVLTVPLSLTGAIAGLYWTQTPVGAPVLVGAVLLVGIVVNNAIVMVEFANQVRQHEGLDRRMAILKAAPMRLRPILMTTLTTVLGLYPLAAGIGLNQGGEFLQPLGIVVFWGLSLATVLTLFVIPCVYVILYELLASLSRVVPALPLNLPK